MKTLRYKFAVAWIALNDNPGDNESVEVMTSYATVALVADLFGKTEERVAEDVYKLREKGIATAVTT